MTKGILKNAKIDASYKNESPNELDSINTSFDRQKVIENTKLNAQLTKRATNEDVEIIKIKKERGKKLSEEEQLKWDERNLLINEMEKSATMKIDEPKTPYEGGFNPNNDYYRTDNEEDDKLEGKSESENKSEAEAEAEAEFENEEDEGFELGEGIDDNNDVKRGEIEVLQQSNKDNKEEEEEEEGEEEKELTPEEKHRIFEEKRKQHYHLKAFPLKQAYKEDENEDEE